MVQGCRQSKGGKKFKGKHELTGEFPKGCVEQGDQTKTPKMGGVYGYFLQPHISPLENIKLLLYQRSVKT